MNTMMTKLTKFNLTTKISLYIVNTNSFYNSTPYSITMTDRSSKGEQVE
jgi:hypothetical protein